MYLRKWRSSFLALILLQCLITGAVKATDYGTSVEARGGEFTLSSVDGPVSLSDLRGQVVLLFFGYTACPDVCPVTLAVISKAFSGMTTGELEKVKALFISLDPERDTPELLRKYTGYFHPNIIGLSGNPEVIHQLLEDYGIKYEKKDRPGSPLGYVISHTPDILVVDREGTLQKKWIPPGTEAKDIAAYIRSIF